MSNSATLAPWATRCLATAKPSPETPPVTTALIRSNCIAALQKARARIVVDGPGRCRLWRLARARTARDAPGRGAGATLQRARIEPVAAEMPGIAARAVDAAEAVFFVQALRGVHAGQSFEIALAVAE